MLNATELAEHYGSEALRLQQAAGMPSEIADAQLLLDWLVDGWKETHVSITDVMQLGPNRLRHLRVRVRPSEYWRATTGWLRRVQGLQETNAAARCGAL